MQPSEVIWELIPWKFDLVSWRFDVQLGDWLPFCWLPSQEDESIDLE